ncbi:MAG TPA: hypothetical protein VIP46_07855 [Pyrinomonadaceae bacterium]
MSGSKIAWLARLAPAAAVVAAALLVSSPAWLSGVPAGSDTVFHASWYTHFSEQLRAGELYPRWLAGMNGGLGSPVFFYYAPLPYHLTALLVAPLAAAGDYGLRHLAYGTALSFVASGLACYLWLRQISTRRGALAGALLYLLAPYHSVVDPLMRGAYSELWAFAWMPLVLYFARRAAAGRGPRLAFAGLSVSYALLVLSHLPATLIFSPLPAAYAYFASGRRAPAALRTLAGLALGAGLACAYLLPALAMQPAAAFADMHADNYFERWITFTKANAHDLHGQLLWGALTSAALVLCFTFITKQRRAHAPAGDAPTREISTPADPDAPTAATSSPAERAAHAEHDASTGDAASRETPSTAERDGGVGRGDGVGRVGRDDHVMPDDRRRELSFWGVAAALSIFMTTFASDPVWRLVPVLQKVQFPWRFQLVLCLAVAGAAAAGLGPLRRGFVSWRALAFASLVTCCWLYFWAGAVRRTYPDLPRPYRIGDGTLRWMDRSRDAPEYRPASAVSNAEHDIETLLQNFCGDLRREPRACVAEGEGAVTVTRAAPRSLDLRVESASGLTFRVTQFHFPGWQATLDGRPHPLTASRPDGLLLLSAPPGTHELRLRLEPTTPERLGLLTSALSALLLALLSARALLPKRPRRR